jgi:preprotein translocase subunit SecF
MSRAFHILAILASCSVISIGTASAQMGIQLSPGSTASDKAAAKKKAAEDRKMKQQKMAGCQNQAKDQKLKGKERTAFIMTCSSSPI